MNLFCNDPIVSMCQVLLLSLGAGGVGLNLVGANHLFMLDMHWNPQLENQACDRIYRVGQKRPVSIHRYSNDVQLVAEVHCKPPLIVTFRIFKADLHIYKNNVKPSISVFICKGDNYITHFKRRLAVNYR